jgi:hypothetical protein
VNTTLVDLKRVLVRQCGMADRNVQMLADPPSPLEVGRVLADSAKQARYVLLVCYVELVSPGGELYLAAKSTDRQTELLAYTALAYTAVRTSPLQPRVRRLPRQMPRLLVAGTRRGGPFRPATGDADTDVLGGLAHRRSGLTDGHTALPGAVQADWSLIHAGDALFRYVRLASKVRDFMLSSLGTREK